MPDYLRIVGPFHAPSGYSHMTRAVLRMALCAGYTVQAIESDYRTEFTRYVTGQTTKTDLPPKVRVPLPAFQWSEVDECSKTEVPAGSPALLIQLPPNLNQRCHYVDGPKIGWTMIESDVLCSEWTWGCRGCDTVLVPSEWCREPFERAGLDDVRVLPIPVDERVWAGEGPSIQFRAPLPEFLFLSVFSTTERKQWRMLMQAFAEEFREEERGKVGLLVHPTRQPEVQEMAGWCRSMGVWVQVDTDARSDHEMASLYRMADCYVMATAEGFGLPFVEAGMAGIPSIALDKGGAADVVTWETGYPCPSLLSPLIGHMPHVYTSGHRFPQTTFWDLRGMLRQAYEDRGAVLQEKGKAAAAAAMQFTPSALAGRFREEIERAARRRREQETRRLVPGLMLSREPGQAPQYALAFGAWGDAFVSVGMARVLRDPSRPLHFIHYGYDAGIADFLREQPDVEDVIQIQPPANRHEMLAQFAKVCQSRWCYAKEWLPWIAEKAGVPAKDVLYTQINQTEDQPLHRWHDAVLPAGIRAWAHTQHRVWGDYILLHPMSTQSAPSSEHWPLWQYAIRWLLDETPYRYVLTGQTKMDLPQSDRLIDLVGRTENMMQVLALCEKSLGVISTCNAVCHWAVIQRIPGLIVSNSVFNWERDYYHQFANCEPNTMLYQYDTLEWFEHVAERWLAERHGITLPEESEEEDREGVTA